MKPSIRKEGSKDRQHRGREGPGGQLRMRVLGGLLHDGRDNPVSRVEGSIQLTGTHGNSGYRGGLRSSEILGSDLRTTCWSGPR